jgi:hypothetical protein
MKLISICLFSVVLVISCKLGKKKVVPWHELVVFSYAPLDAILDSSRIDSFSNRNPEIKLVIKVLEAGEISKRVYDGELADIIVTDSKILLQDFKVKSLLWQDSIYYQVQGDLCVGIMDASSNKSGAGSLAALLIRR